MVYLLLVAFIAIALGLVVNYFGYRLFKIILPIWGFFAGFALGGSVMSLILGESLFASILSLVVAIIFGLILAVLSYFVYFIGIIVLGFSFGFGLTSAIMYGIGFSTDFIVCGIAVGVGLLTAFLTLVLNIQKYLIVVITSFGGSTYILGGVLLLLGKITLAQLELDGNPIKPILDDSWFWMIAWIVLIVSGMLVQSITSRGVELETVSLSSIKD